MPSGSASRVRWFATSSSAAWRLPGMMRFSRLAVARAARRTARPDRPLAGRKAGGHSIPPFIGPITTGTPKPYSNDGSRGETGIGWWITSMRSSATSWRTRRRCSNWEAKRVTNPVVR